MNLPAGKKPAQKPVNLAAIRVPNWAKEKYGIGYTFEMRINAKFVQRLIKTRPTDEDYPTVYYEKGPRCDDDADDNRSVDNSIPHRNYLQFFHLVERKRYQSL